MPAPPVTPAAVVLFPVTPPALIVRVLFSPETRTPPPARAVLSETVTPLNVAFPVRSMPPPFAAAVFPVMLPPL